MTYFTFLGIFVCMPIIMLSVLTIYDHRRGKTQPAGLDSWPVWAVIGVHMLIALVYTTPWDNYLVATRVWSYNPALVTGIVFGWVPLEEYTFFLLQPILTGLWLMTLMRYVSTSKEPIPQRSSIRLIVLSILLPIWIISALILITGWKPGTYLGLELIWALPPIMLQLLFGADILWKYRRHVFLAIATATIYLSLADTVAIGAGTWTIDPEQSLPVLLGGVLPIEEFVFFMLTNVLLVLGLTLMVAKESHERSAALLKRLPFANKSEQIMTD